MWTGLIVLRRGTPAEARAARCGNSVRELWKSGPLSWPVLDTDGLASLSAPPSSLPPDVHVAEAVSATRRSDSSDRGVVAEGVVAREWLARHGVVVTVGGGRLRLFADAVGSEELVLRRMWHTGREVRRRGRPGGAVVSLLVEGVLTVCDGAGVERAVETGGGLVLWSDSAVTATSEGRCGTIEVAVGRQVLERFFAWTDVGVTLIPAGVATARILLAAVSTALTGPVQPRDPAWPLIGDMMGSGVGALLAEIGPPISPSAPATAVRLLRRAHAVIERHCGNAAFDVRALASELSVSVASLYSAFSHLPQTPAQAVRAARVRAANRMLDFRPTATAADQEAVAELAGFISAEAMSRAIRTEARRRRP